jgi:16S rRNA (cytidine1402-2'-O)-methyltransferase
VEALPYTLIFLESPHRLLDALADIESVLGGRMIAVARELTKLHEEIWRGMVPGALEYFLHKEPRGEFTLVVAGKPDGETRKWAEDKVSIAIKFGLKFGESPSALAKKIADESGWSRKEIYTLIMESKRQ